MSRRGDAFLYSVASGSKRFVSIFYPASVIAQERTRNRQGSGIFLRVSSGRVRGCSAVSRSRFHPPPHVPPLPPTLPQKAITPSTAPPREECALSASLLRQLNSASNKKRAKCSA